MATRSKLLLRPALPATALAGPAWAQSTETDPADPPQDATETTEQDVQPEQTVIATGTRRPDRAVAASPGPAAPGTAEQDVQPEQTVIVTGTRRTDRVVADSPVPIDVISAEALSQS